MPFGTSSSSEYSLRGGGPCGGPAPNSGGIGGAIAANGTGGRICGGGPTPGIGGPPPGGPNRDLLGRSASRSCLSRSSASERTTSRRVADARHALALKASDLRFDGGNLPSHMSLELLMLRGVRVVGAHHLLVDLSPVLLLLRRSGRLLCCYYGAWIAQLLSILFRKSDFPMTLPCSSCHQSTCVPPTLR